MKLRKKLLASVLALATCIALVLPTNVQAYEGNNPDGTKPYHDITVPSQGTTFHNGDTFTAKYNVTSQDTIVDFSFLLYKSGASSPDNQMYFFYNASGEDYVFCYDSDDYTMFPLSKTGYSSLAEYQKNDAHHANTQYALLKANSATMYCCYHNSVDCANYSAMRSGNTVTFNITISDSMMNDNDQFAFSNGDDETYYKTITYNYVADGATIYRLYNPVSGEHLYTPDYNEVTVLSTSYGWTYEGIGWVAPKTGTPVYRLYNPALGNHLYTTDTNEISVITKQGWQLDNNGKPLYYSGGSKPIYRVYNEGLNGMHHLTTDKNEYDTLPSYGWAQENVAFYSLR